MRRALAFVIAASILAACSGDGDDSGPQPIPTTCGLPSPTSKEIDHSIVPDVFLLDGTGRLASVDPRRRGFTAVINVPYSVGEAFKLYGRKVVGAGYEVVGKDNEGFEAEIYLRVAKQIGAVTIRRSLCDDASVVFVNFVPVKLTRP
ncbi:MAG: hypothetical protein ACRDJI_00710 [Actinomycetota bacterium]